MPRKSLAVRLAETKATLELWKAAGMEQDRSALFMRDMIIRMERNRGMSTGQRKYVDSLIEQGAPKVHNAELCERINQATAVPGMEQCASALSDFGYKLSKGWDLSPKQKKFLDSMLAQADELQETGIPELSESDKNLVEGLIRACRRQNGFYWNHRPGAHKAYEAAVKELQLHNTITPRTLARFKNSNKSVTRKYENPRLVAGQLAYCRRDAAMIMSAPYFDSRGCLVQDVLVNGELKTVLEDSIGKRRSRA